MMEYQDFRLQYQFEIMSKNLVRILGEYCNKNVNNHMRHIRENNGLTKNTEVITAYIAFVRRKKFSIEALRELGLSAIMVVINICQYTETNL